MKKSSLADKFIIVATASFLSAGLLSGQTQTFTSSGTFTVPAGVTSVVVECWGAGGGGGSSRSAGAARAGGGGGGGGYSLSVVAVTPGNNYNIVVGTGGTGGVAGGGGTGGSSTFNTTTVIALGGSGGARGGAGAGGAGAALGTGTTRYTGGNGAAGVNATGSGGGGGGAGSNGNGGAASGTTAGTGTALNGGNGGTGISGTSSAGNAGNIYGGGGSGGYALAGAAERNGGAGANGLVIISWVTTYYSQNSGDPSVLLNWNTNPGGGGTSPSNFTANLQTFVIQNGHTMSTSGSGWSVSGNITKVQVQNGGTLTETTEITLSSATTLQIDNGGTLNHNVNSVTIFGGSESFGNTSTVNYGYSGAQSVVNATYGNLTLSGSGIKTIATSTVNGILSLEGTATVTGSPTYGANSTLQYKGSAAQTTGGELPATFSGSGGIIFNNGSGVTLSADATVATTITMTLGNITTGSFILILSNSAAGSLTRTSGSIVGKFRRAISTTTGNNYLFPVGTETFYRPAVMNFSSISATVSITTEFISTPPYGFAGYTDGAVTLNSIFTDGSWRFTSSGTPTVNYTLTLTADGFTSFTLNSNSRITGRDNSNSTWRAIGTHGSLSGNDISRTGITLLNTTSFDFAIASECSTASMSYSFERSIIVDYTRVSGGTDLYNFPMLVYLTGQTFLKTSPAGPITNTNGYDIIFADNNNNKVDHQIEYYNGTNGDLIAWVRIPVLSATSNTVLKILYGNQQITTDPSVTTVWDSHYKGVWHLNDNNLLDYTAYANPGTPYNTPTYPSGQIYNSLGMNGTNEYMEAINAPEINFAGNITVSAWVYMAAGGRDQKIAGNQNNSTGGYKFGIYTNNKVEFEIRNSANIPSLNRDVVGGTTLTTGQWYYLAGVSSDVLDSIKTFVNGVSERPFKKTGILGVASNTLVVGKEPFVSNYYFSGRFDELRISDKVRSDGWLRTEYFNQSSPSTFYSVGSEVSLTTLPSVSICDLPVTLPSGYPAGGTYSGNPYITGNVFNPPSSGTYSIIYTYTAACGPTSVAKEITVTPVPPAPTAPDKTYCTGQIANLEATSGQNFKWYSGGTLVSTANPFSTGITAPGTYTYTVTQSVNGCESTATTVTLTIVSGITVTAHPQASSVCEGNNASFSVTATGYNMTYQWQENGINVSNGGIYSGATTSTLTLTDPGMTKSGATYRCVISSSCGTSPVTSNSAALTVNPVPVATFSYAGSPYCRNASNALPTFSGGGSAGIFSSTAGLVFANVSTGEVNIVSSVPGTYTLANTIAASGGCAEVIATSQLTISVDLTWTGSLSSDWNDPGNWSCGYVPDQLSVVYIPDVSNKPLLSSGSSGSVNNITIDASSSLTVTGNSITIDGTITNDGIFDVTDGTVEMTGAVAQNIGAGVFASNSVRDLIINNAAGVTLQGVLNVTRSLLMSNGDLVSGGNLTMVSTGAQTAYIDGTGSGTVTGNVTMQRYLPSSFGYRYVSSPFQAATVNQLSDEVNLAFWFPPVYRYDESRLSSGWVSYVNPVSVLNPLHGYSVNFGSVNAPLTADITGVVNNGPLSITLYNNDNTYTKGYNLVGNPYPSPIDWDATTGWTRTNIDDAVYFFKPSATDQYGGSYSSYVNGSSSDLIVNNIIPSMQGFFVHVSDGTYPVTGTLEMTNDVRTDDLIQPFAKSSSAKEVPSEVRLSAMFSSDTTKKDHLLIYIDEKATDSFDFKTDALKLMNTDLTFPNLYALSSDTRKLSINGLPVMEGASLQVPLGLKTNIPGTVVFKMRSLSGSFEGKPITLFDNLTGIEQDMRNGGQYSITLTNSEYLNRFFLNIGSGATDIEKPPARYSPFKAWYADNIVRIEIEKLTGRGMLRLTGVSGQVIFSDIIVQAGYHEIAINLRGGIYIVTLTDDSGRYSSKLIVSGL